MTRRRLHPLERTVADALAGIGGEIIVGVSGGADSVALLRALKAAGRKMLAVNCNFGLRGSESDRDSEFVVRLCRECGIELSCHNCDVEAYIARCGGSVEMACRELRYDIFRRLLSERGAARIAVAHNSDDNAETLLLNLMRSAGVRGLKGMLPDTGEIVRPLLEVSRSEIESYLAEIGQDYVTDSTNLSDDYRRNFLRLKVIPLLETRWPEARKAIAATQRILRAEAEFVDSAAQVDSDILAWERIAQAPDAVTLIHRFVLPLNPSASQIAEMAAHSAAPHAGKKWLTRLGSIDSERDGLHRRFAAQMEEAPPMMLFRLKYTLEVDRAMRKLRRPTAVFLPRRPDGYRLRRPGRADRIAPLGMRGTSLVSDVMKDARLTRAERECVRLLENPEGEIVWVENLKRSRHDLIPADVEEVYVLSADTKVVAWLKDIGAEQYASESVDFMSSGIW